MADLAQLERALINADAAGDTEAARTLAQAIKAQRVQASQTDQRSPLQQMMQNIVAGGLRGAGSIGATLLTPFDMLAGNTSSIGNPERRKAMDAGLRELGADTESTAFGVGKLGTEVAGTMGGGGLLARGLSMLPGAARVAPLIDSVGSAGFSAGGTTGAKALGLRTLGGGASGAAMAGMINPEDAGSGAVVGAALPGALKAAGTAGGAIGSMLQGADRKGAAELARALGLNGPDDLAAAIAKLRGADPLISKPTVAQALQTPQAGVLQRVVHDSAGGSALRDTLQAQAAARSQALERIAPTNPTGLGDARNELGGAIIKAAKAGDAAAKQRTRDAFAQVPLDEASIYLPLDEMRTAADKYLGRGTLPSLRGPVDDVLKQAETIGMIDLPAVQAVKTGGGQLTLAQAVRKAGGLSATTSEGLGGEVRALRGDLKNLVRNNGGMSPGRMAATMQEAGYLADDSTDALFSALKDEALGKPTYSIYDDMSRTYGAGRDAAMGAAAADSVPAKVSLAEVQNLRSSIGELEREARAAGRDKAAAALGSMKQSIDDKINQVVAGDGLIDENLPTAWADGLTAALKAKKDQVAQFRTGPQADIFRQGKGGAPLIQGGEATRLFWGNRPGLADDVKSFKRLIGDNPRLLGQFQSMVTTEGAATGTAAGNLSSKFARWVDNTLPGLKETFTPEQVGTFQRIAADIKRAESAAALGMSRGSNTYQNAANALDLGLLDSPLLGMAANRIPVLGSFTGPMLEGLRTTARTSKGQRLAGLLGDSEAAADSLGLLGQVTRSQEAAGLLGPWIYRAAPALSTGR